MKLLNVIARRPAMVRTTLVLLILSASVGVRACIDGATNTELAFAGTWSSCDQNLILQYWKDWGVTDASWDPAGISDDCNEALPFAKVMNAIALIQAAPVSIAGQQNGPFHVVNDYSMESMAINTPYHANVYLKFIENNGSGVEGLTHAGSYTDLDCPIFNYPGDTPDPTSADAEMLAERSAVMVHEMWHNWQDAHRFNSDHINGPTGSCTASGASCDYFYSHSPGSALDDGTFSNELGGLNKTIVVNNVGYYFHSPYQIMTEFESDIAIFGPANIPFAVRQEAQSVGNYHLTSNFVNGAAFTIGNPVPFP